MRRVLIWESARGRYSRRLGSFDREPSSRAGRIGEPPAVSRVTSSSSRAIRCSVWSSARDASRNLRIASIVGLIARRNAMPTTKTSTMSVGPMLLNSRTTSFTSRLIMQVYGQPGSPLLRPSSDESRRRNFAVAISMALRSCSRCPSWTPGSLRTDGLAAVDPVPATDPGRPGAPTTARERTLRLGGLQLSSVVRSAKASWPNRGFSKVDGFSSNCAEAW